MKAFFMSVIYSKRMIFLLVFFGTPSGLLRKKHLFSEEDPKKTAPFPKQNHRNSKYGKTGHKQSLFSQVIQGG